MLFLRRSQLKKSAYWFFNCMQLAWLFSGVDSNFGFVQYHVVMVLYYSLHVCRVHCIRHFFIVLLSNRLRYMYNWYLPVPRFSFMLRLQFLKISFKHSSILQDSYDFSTFGRKGTSFKTSTITSSRNILFFRFPWCGTRTTFPNPIKPKHALPQWFGSNKLDSILLLVSKEGGAGVSLLWCVQEQALTPGLLLMYSIWQVNKVGQ